MKKQKLISTILLVLAFALLSSMVFAAEDSTQQIRAGQLKVGASKEIINPPDYVFAPDVKWFKREERDYLGIHDDTYVRTVVLDNGITRAAFVSVELKNIPDSEGFVEYISAEIGIKPENLFLSATHTHNTISVDMEQSALVKYYEFIKKATIKSLKDSIAKLQPSRVGYSTGKAYVNANRIKDYGDYHSYGYNPDGPSDKTVAAVTFTSNSGKPVAVIYNYAVHGVVMFLAKTNNDHPEITGDLPGVTSRYIEDQYDNDMIALFSMGAAGDQNPLLQAMYNQGAPGEYDLGDSGYAVLESLGRRLGEEVVRLTNSNKYTKGEVALWGKNTTVLLPARKQNSDGEWVDDNPIPMGLKLFMIDDIALTGICAEVFTEIGMNIKEESPFDSTMVMTMMAPKTSNTYVPTDEAYLMSSPKAARNSFKPGYAEPMFIEALNDMMNEYMSLVK